MIQHPEKRRGQCLIFMASCALLVAAVVLNGCRTGTGETEGAAPGQVAEMPSNSFAVGWKAELSLGSSHLKALHVNDDRVFAYAADNRCFWINRSSGLVSSIAPIGRPTDTVYEPVTLSDRIVFPATNQLSVFDRNGKLMHKIPLRYGLSSGAVGLHLREIGVRVVGGAGQRRGRDHQESLGVRNGFQPFEFLR